MDYTNKVVVLTGAAGGIGSEMVRRFAALGASTALLDVSMEALEKTIERLGLEPGRTFAGAVDVSDETSVKTVIADIIKRFGHIDVLINAAGIPGPSARTEDYSFADFKKVYSVNVFGTYLMMQNVLPLMQARHSGVILNFGSVSGMRGYPYEIAYGSSKAAIIHLTKNAANENGGNGVRINAISPGWVQTNMMRTIVESYKDVGIAHGADYVTLGPMGRPAFPEEIANVAVFMCSDEAHYVNGSNFLVDGGMTLD